jgi:hypothetical protein
MIFYLFIHLVVSDILPTIKGIVHVSHEKYLTYQWAIKNCNNVSKLIITKNNVTYLNINVEPNTYRTTLTIPWCAFRYDPHDVYEWHIENDYDYCNDTANKSKLTVTKLPILYATNELNIYEFSNTAIVEIPHFKNSLELSCMYIYLKRETYGDGPSIVKIYKDVDMCPYDSFSDYYYKSDFKFEYRNRFNVYMSNITIGCTYPGQTGPFDISLGGRYIIYSPDYIKLGIRIDTYVDNTFKLATIVLGGILAGIVGLIVLLCGFCMFIRCWCTPDQHYDPIYNDNDNDNDNDDNVNYNVINDNNL